MSEKISVEEIKQVLEKHSKWLRGDYGGECANLDYSCLPLKCGGLKRKIDRRFLRNSPIICARWK